MKNIRVNNKIYDTVTNHAIFFSASKNKQIYKTSSHLKNYKCESIRFIYLQRHVDRPCEAPDEVLIFPMLLFLYSIHTIITQFNYQNMVLLQEDNNI